MALISPGVQVSVIDESFYTPAAPGTRPLFIVASAANKSNASSTGTAAGTLANNAGKVYLITSQRDLVETFGEPTFKVDANNNPIHAGEQNEYGLQAAYSYLGVSNSAFVVRAGIDLALLDATSDAPGGEPQDGTFWLDTGTTQFGIFEWDGRPVTVKGGQTFSAKTPLVVLETSKLSVGVPKVGVGRQGDYAIAPGAGYTTADDTNTIPDQDDRQTHELSLYYKNKNNDWVKVGSPEWKASWPTVSSAVFTGTTTGSFTINTVSFTWDDAVIDSLATLRDAINSAVITGVTAEVVNGRLELYSTGVDIEIELTGEDSTVLADIGLPVGIHQAPALAIQSHTQVPTWKLRGAGQEPKPKGSIWIKSTEPNGGARWRLKKYNGDTLLWETVESPLYASNQSAIAAMDPTTGGLGLQINSAFVQFNFTESANTLADFRVLRRARIGSTTARTKVINDVEFSQGTVYQFRLSETLTGSAVLNTKTIIFERTLGATVAENIVAAINTAGFTNILADVTSDNRVELVHNDGGEMRFGTVTGGNAGLASLGVYGLDSSVSGGNTSVYSAPAGDSQHLYIASNWIPLTITPDTPQRIQQSYYIQSTVPSTLVADGTLWYSSVVDELDIMIHNGATWVGYLNYDHGDGAGLTDPRGPIVSATLPETQVSGATLADGDLWIDTGDIENYPLIKKYDKVNNVWVSLDSSDQTTENGVLFADARWNTDGLTTEPALITELLTSNFLDFDAPDPALYPRGMLLVNLRRSGFNVKRFVRNYIDVSADNARYKSGNDQSDGGFNPTSGDRMEGYYPHRWVTESGNQANGAGSFGRNAQRTVIIQSLQALVNSNQEIRDTERNEFNLLACPGYPELIGEMVTLNYDRGLSAFVVGDTPARLRPDATTINNWGTNLAGALQDDDTGLVSFDEYLGVFYPWGFTSDNAGRDVAVPPSHMICRMIALSDQVSYPWFAPAGTRRGGITNASAVGYISSEGEFISVALNNGQRDTLYNVKVNPITFFVGSGLVNFGQKTRARNASALDRINVARLVIYLRGQLNKLAKPYIFEPNDKITRDEIKQQVESLLLELVGQRALYDFLVVCDESNNTPSRIDRNELYVDIAIEPVKAVEFIYIPVRLKNTGEIAGL